MEYDSITATALFFIGIWNNRSTPMEDHTVLGKSLAITYLFDKRKNRVSSGTTRLSITKRRKEEMPACPMAVEGIH